MARTQGEMNIRAVTLANLQAMCERASGMAHTYSVEMRRTVCELTYSNPDEYGNPNPYTVRLPVIRNEFERENPYVLFTVQSEYGGGDEHGREACFQTIESEIFDGAELFRKPDSGEWLTRAEFAKQRGNPVYHWSKPYSAREVYANGKLAFTLCLARDKESGAYVIPPTTLDEMANRYAYDLQKKNRRDGVFPPRTDGESV